MSRLFSLSGQVVLLTGATGHLGRALSEGLAEAGATLALGSSPRSAAEAERLAAELSAAHGVPAAAFPADLADPAAVGGLAAAVGEHFGRLDCLVNNAAFGAANALAEMTSDEWEAGLSGTVTVAFRLMQAVLPRLKVARGSVINVSSMYGLVSPDPRLYEGNAFANPPNYGAGKAALLQLTRYAAVHLAPYGVRVNALSPGPFPSPAVQQDGVFVDRLAHKVPLGRIGQPHELKGAVVFLASSAASFVTGHNLVVDGGWTVW